jgi:16S rRNA (guanine527-N7)-methyltransferase
MKDSPEALVRALDVSRETVERLVTHRQLLAAWAPRINLVGPRELDEYWVRHALDCAQLVRLAPGACRWVDLGSGAGFPGLIVACMLAGGEGVSVDLVEPSAKRAAFLREAIRETGAPARVCQRRAEDLSPDTAYDVVTARAFAPLPRIMSYATRLISGGALGLFLKGADAAAELEAARRDFTLDAELLPSLADPGGRVVRITAAAPKQ